MVLTEEKTVVISQENQLNINEIPLKLMASILHIYILLNDYLQSKSYYLILKRQLLLS